jgi:hypothetical protein
VSFIGFSRKCEKALENAGTSGALATLELLEAVTYELALLHEAFKLAFVRAPFLPLSCASNKKKKHLLKFVC